MADVRHIVENLLMKTANKELKVASEKTENIRLSNEVNAFLKTELEALIVI